jgi:hypothetical protein
LSAPDTRGLIESYSEAHGLSPEEQIGLEDRVAARVAEDREADEAYRNNPQRQRYEHADRAHEIAAIRAKLNPRVDEGIAHAAATLKGGRSADWRSFWEALNGVGRNLELDERLAEREREHRKAAYVVHEPPPYSKSSPHSWTLDVASVTAPDLAPLLGTRAGHGPRVRPAATRPARPRRGPSCQQPE